MHLAAGLQVVGYRHVVAAAWEVRDSVGPMLADRFYETVVGMDRPDSSRAARGLHRAVALLRKEHMTDPLVWAPYVHLGP
jgi:CHAT domain-containing protein